MVPLLEEDRFAVFTNFVAALSFKTGMFLIAIAVWIHLIHHFCQRLP
jgi:hypothetical protein